MLRYRTLKVFFNSENEAVNFLHQVEQHSNSNEFSFDRDALRLYERNDKVSQILAKVPDTLDAVIILAVKGDCFYVANIIPYRHSFTRISKEKYNKILQSFYDNIMHPLVNEDNVDFPGADYTVEALIPKSYQQLRLWALACPSSPFLHQLDLEKWFEFLCQLQDNNEYLSTGDLEQWLSAELNWNDDLVEETILHYEHDTDLLRYYAERNT